jgi:hypothetical protein
MRVVVPHLPAARRVTLGDVKDDAMTGPRRSVRTNATRPRDRSPQKRKLTEEPFRDAASHAYGFRSF